MSGQQRGDSRPAPAAAAPGEGPRLAELLASPEVPGPEALVQVIALDGPAGTGKSSVAKGLAARLGWRFVDTGATYRAVTLAVLDAGVDPERPAAVEEVVREARLVLVTDPAAPAVQLNGRDVSAAVRSDEVTAHVSAVSSVPAVRALLIAFQRYAIGTGGAVVEGRDIATVVAPHAALKVYLNARPEVRAARRAAESPAGPTSAQPCAQAPGAQPSQPSSPAGPVEGPASVQPAEPEEVARELALARHAAVAEALARRDHRDSQTNKLVASQGAVEVDTSDRTLDEVIAEVLRLAEESGLRP